MDRSVITRKDARAQGLKTYFTGKPCVRGHLARRNVITSQCSECGKLYKAKWYHEDGGKAMEKFSAIRRQYGLSTEEFFKLYEDGNRQCAICSDPVSMHEFHVDHDHSTGTARGILCAPCNLGLGQFKDSPALLERAAMYLRSSRAEPSKVPTGSGWLHL